MKKYTNVLFLITTLLNTISVQSMVKEQVATDTQIYHLLSFATQKNPEYYLPHELVQIIAINTHEITQLRHYQKNGKCMESGDSLLCFIADQGMKGIDVELTVNIIKVCLQYSKKSLCDLKTEYSSVLHKEIKMVYPTPYVADEKFLTKYKDIKCYCVDALCQIIGEDLMQLLYIKNPFSGYMVLTETAFTMCGAFNYYVNKEVNKKTLKTIDLLHWEHTPNYVKVILKYLNEEERVSLIFDSMKIKFDEKMQELMNGDDSVD